MKDPVLRMNKSTFDTIVELEVRIVRLQEELTLLRAQKTELVEASRQKRTTPPKPKKGPDPKVARSKRYTAEEATTLVFDAIKASKQTLSASQLSKLLGPGIGRKRITDICKKLVKKKILTTGKVKYMYGRDLAIEGTTTGWAVAKRWSNGKRPAL